MIYNFFFMVKKTVSKVVNACDVCGSTDRVYYNCHLCNTSHCSNCYDEKNRFEISTNSGNQTYICDMCQRLAEPTEYEMDVIDGLFAIREQRAKWTRTIGILRDEEKALMSRLRKVDAKLFWI